MDWDTELPLWPNHEMSRRVAVRPNLWHVQAAGTGPLILMVHGAGGSTHSFRDLIPELAHDHRVVAIDLPGQGFTRAETRQRLSLPLMAEDLAALAASEGWRPSIIVGHSAGAALALRLSQYLTAPDGTAPRVVGINAALAPFEGVAGWLFPVLARTLALNPFVPRLFALTTGNRIRVRQLLEATGSRLGADAIAQYTRLIADRDHVDATLRMMAQWDLAPLLRDLPRITASTTLLAGALDRAVPPATSERATTMLPNATFVPLADLGHLAHEEAPALIAGLIRDAHPHAS